MDITKSREDFEVRFPMPIHVIRCGTGYAVTSYSAWEAHSYLDLWKGWQASRESVEVELPSQDEYDDPLSAYNAISDCKKILRTAGIRIKGESE